MIKGLIFLALQRNFFIDGYNGNIKTYILQSEMPPSIDNNFCKQQ